MQKSCFVHSNLNECRFHTRKHSNYFPFIDITYYAPTPTSLYVEFVQHSIFKNRYAYFLRCDID